MSKINWSKALADYLKDVPQSYVSIAGNYGVSLQAVKKRAGKEGWQDLRLRSIQKVNQELPILVGESVADINSRHIQAGKILQAVGMEAITKAGMRPSNADQARKFVDSGSNLERKAAGLDKPQQQTTVNPPLSTPEVN